MEKSRVSAYKNKGTIKAIEEVVLHASFTPLTFFDLALGPYCRW
jgi:hypothetical protein